MAAVGIVVVIVSVLAGFLLAGGPLAVLFQYTEFITIGGATIGSLLIMVPMTTVNKMIAYVTASFGSHGSNKQDYLELLKSFNDLFLIAQRDGLLSIESHIETPESSSILSTNHKFMENSMAVAFFCDTMKVMLSGGIPPHELENLIDNEIETFEKEELPVAGTLQKVGDALPGLGIVAAVLGIIITMGSINDGAEAVGHHVAAALVGTFLGVLMAYGFVGPLANNVEHQIEGKIQYLQTIKACVMGYAKGNPPIIAVELARRTIFSDARPTFSELEEFLRNKG